MAKDIKYSFKVGDKVLFKHILGMVNPGVIMVMGEARAMLMKNSDDKAKLMGIKCIWFSSNGELQEYVFHTKDLVPLNSDEGIKLATKLGIELKKYV